MKLKLSRWLLPSLLDERGVFFSDQLKAGWSRDMSTVDSLKKLKPNFLNPVRLNDVTGTFTIADRAIIHVLSPVIDGKFLYANSIKADGSFVGKIMSEDSLSKYEVDEKHFTRVLLSLSLVKATCQENGMDLTDVLMPEAIELVVEGVLDLENRIRKVELRRAD